MELLIALTIIPIIGFIIATLNRPVETTPEQASEIEKAETWLNVLAPAELRTRLYGMKPYNRALFEDILMKEYTQRKETN